MIDMDMFCCLSGLNYVLRLRIQNRARNDILETKEENERGRIIVFHATIRFE